MPLAAAGEAAEDVAAADDDGDLAAGRDCFGDVASETLGDGHVDAEIAFAHQGFAGELEQQPPVGAARMRLLPSWLP